jgi:threonine dehydratase
MTLITLEQVRQSQTVIMPHLHRTPMLTAHNLGAMTDTHLYFKAELFQRAGSFKPRGALNKLHRLTAAERARGVIAISAGNHAAGLAYAASVMGVQATIVMPEAAVRSKVEATRGYGATAILHGTGKDLMPKARELQQAHDLVFAPPFDDPHVIAGQGTVGLEILEDVPAPDVVLVPVGGGGLIAGVASVIKALHPQTRVIGVEPVGAAKMHSSLQQGKAVALDQTHTIADGLAAPFAGEHTFAHVRQFVDEMVLVTDEEITTAMLLIMERSKLFVEPSGAAGFAALLHNKITVQPGATVVCVLSGGNIDRERLRMILCG